MLIVKHVNKKYLGTEGRSQGELISSSGKRGRKKNIGGNSIFYKDQTG